MKFLTSSPSSSIRHPVSNLSVSAMSNAGEKRWNLIFAYGTLKRGFGNYNLMVDLINQNDAVYEGEYLTHQLYPLVCGPFGIPYLINLPGAGNRVRGELYSVSDRALSRIDELEGTAIGHYNRLPVRLIDAQKEKSDEDAVVFVEAECYYADSSFGEGLWRRKGRVGLSGFTEREAGEYVKRDNRRSEIGIVDEVKVLFSLEMIELFGSYS